MKSNKREVKIVEFFHPGGEHLTTYNSSHKWKKKEVLESEFMPSNIGEHRRKFMINKGKYLNKDMSQSNETDIAFWGEYENPTKFKAIKYDNIDEKKKDKYFHENDIPQYVHYEFYEEKDNKVRENTDPYIFGDTFYYCCCKQTDRKTGKARYLQTDLGKGSLVIYGCKLKDKFLLDTVFVIKNFEPYSTCATDDLYFGKVLADLSNTYVNTSLKPLEKSEAVGGEKFVLYSGATYNSKYSIGGKEIFSFFPCKPVNRTEDISKCASESAFSRPYLDLQKYSLKLPGQGAPANILENYTKNNCITISGEETIAMYWQMIVDDIIGQGLSIGIYTEEPKF